jgi:XTP/dITP diphosphohydrolase
MKTVIAATHNAGKMREFERILIPYGIALRPAPKGVLEAVEENGATFCENALIKARAVFLATGLPALADDSGLCINALGGRPGVFSARYAGEDTPYDEKIRQLLEELANIPKARRGAHFECAVALVTPLCERCFTGRCNGVIGQSPRGENGFGYDPIFVVGGESFAQMSDEDKDKISHRARALAALGEEINSYL